MYVHTPNINHSSTMNMCVPIESLMIILNIVYFMVYYDVLQKLLETRQGIILDYSSWINFMN